MRFIFGYPTLIYTKYVILSCFVINNQKTLLISQMIITNIRWSHTFRIYSFCDILKGHFFAVDTESSIFSKASGLYCGSADRVRYFYNRKVIVYNVFLVKNLYRNGELSIFFQFFLIPRDTCWVSIFIFLSFVRMRFHISTFITICNICCIFHFSHNVLSQSKDTIKFVLRSQSKEPPFICYLSVIR